METLTAYVSLRSRSTMGAEEGAALASALAERALCCGRGAVEAKADAAAAALLAGGGGELARRGAWLVLAARAGGLENEFFPPPSSPESGGGGARKAAAAAAAPKAVSGCVRAMSAAMEKGVGFAGAGAGDSRKEVGAVCCGDFWLRWVAPALCCLRVIVICRGCCAYDQGKLAGLSQP